MNRCAICESSSVGLVTLVSDEQRGAGESTWGREEAAAVQAAELRRESVAVLPTLSLAPLPRTRAVSPYRPTLHAVGRPVLLGPVEPSQRGERKEREPVEGRARTRTVVGGLR